MKKGEISEIIQGLSVLKNQKLQYGFRMGASGGFGFGPMIEAEGLVMTDEGIAHGVKTVAKYALHIECMFRMICGSHIIFAKHDVFLPSSKIYTGEDFDWESFDYDVLGNNKLDELMEKYISPDSPELIVEDLAVNKFGDLKIKLTNSFVLELFSDASGDSENWRFFDFGVRDAKHLVILGDGIEEDDE